MEVTWYIIMIDNIVKLRVWQDLKFSIWNNEKMMIEISLLKS